MLKYKNQYLNSKYVDLSYQATRPALYVLYLTVYVGKLNKELTEYDGLFFMDLERISHSVFERRKV